MKKVNYMEIVGILALSLFITSTMAVSGGVPEMIKEFCSNSSSIYSRSSVELLISVPSFSIMIIIALTPVLTRYIKERVMISSGLLIIGIAGIIPFFSSSYILIFMSRICLGIGIGLVNTLAVTLIGERFDGDLRQKLQGIRCSMETLGEASLIFVAGQLLVFGWNYSFLVYGGAFIIFLLYTFFVPEKEKIQSEPAATVSNQSRHLTTYEKRIIIQNAILGMLLVSTLSANALRISSFIVESEFGTAIEGSTILSLSILTGFVGGLTFGYLLQKFQKLLLPAAALLIAAGFIFMVFGGNLITVAIGASLCGFFATIALSYMFNALSDSLPTDILTTANSAVLVGCNLGGTITPFVLQAIGLIDSSLAAGFLAYAAVYIILGTVLLMYQLIKKYRS